jgi:hypothetical protein
VYVQPYPQPRPIRAVSGLALASLVLGIASFVLGPVGIITGVLAVILGIVGLVRVRQNSAALSGRGLAIGGVSTGAGAAALWIVFFILLGSTCLFCAEDVDAEFTFVSAAASTGPCESGPGNTTCHTVVLNVKNPEGEDDLRTNATAWKAISGNGWVYSPTVHSGPRALAGGHDANVTLGFEVEDGSRLVEIRFSQRTENGQWVSWTQTIDVPEY